MDGSIVRADQYGEPDATVDEVAVARPCYRAPLSRRCSHVLARCPAMRVRSGSLMRRSRKPPATPARPMSSGNTLFIGLGRGELLPYGSYYLTGFLYDWPLARLRADLLKLGVERAAGQAEPEDHAAILCEVMAGVVDRQFPASRGADRALFEKHLSPWIGRFFADLERAEAADFYRPVGMLGCAFMDYRDGGLHLGVLSQAQKTRGGSE
jgi:hypothetical protein